MAKQGQYRALREPVNLSGGNWRVTGRGQTASVEHIADKLVKALRSDFVGSTGFRVRIHGQTGLYENALDVPKNASKGRIEDLLREYGDDLEVEVDRCGERYDY